MAGDKTLWLTGANSELMIAMARRYARARNFVFISLPESSGAEALVEAYPENVHLLPIDMQSSVSIDQALAMLTNYTDHLDLLVVGSGDCELTEDRHYSRETIERVARANFLGAVDVVQRALPLLRASKRRAQIAAVGSLATLLPFPSASIYGASAAALEYFLQSLRLDDEQELIDLTIVRTGFGALELPRSRILFDSAPQSLTKAAEDVCGAIERRYLFADFPRRAAFALKLLRLAPAVWMKNVAPKYRKPKLL